MAIASVIIPAYNAEKTIRRCVTSVLENECDDFEVIVVDDCSADATGEIIKSIADRRVSYFRNTVNRGSYFSRNHGIRRASGEVLLLLDSDAYVDKDWIAAHLRLHRRSDAGIIGGGIRGVHASIAGRCDRYCNWWSSIPYSRDYQLKELHLPTLNLSVKADVFSKIGFFDETLRFCGDAEFCFRALRGGIKVYFKSDIVVYHCEKETFKGYMTHQRNWGAHAIRTRKSMKMDYHYLLPSSYIMGWLFVLPLAVLSTLFIVTRWVRHDPCVVMFAPLIFIGKLGQALAIKDSFSRAE